MAQSSEHSPFTDGDLQRLKLEAASNEKIGFEFFRKTDHVELWRRPTEESPIGLVKGFLHFPGIPVETIFKLIVDIELRRQWEKQIPVLEVLDDNSSYRTIYWVVKTPIGVSDRDFVQHMTYGSDEEGTKYILYKNAVHPSRPERKGIVRAKTIFSGTLIYPDKTDPNSTCLITLFQDDIKGYVPTAVVNYFYSKAPIVWHENITSYYEKVYSKKDRT